MFLGIFVSVAGTALCISHVTVWFFIVLGTLSISSWLKRFVSSNSLVIFFVVSVLGGLLFLLSCSSFWFSPLLLQLSLLFKLGFAPFQFWVLKLLCELDLVQTCVFLGPLKYGLLWVFLSAAPPFLVFLLAAAWVGLIMLWLSTKIAYVLYASGSSQFFVYCLLSPPAWTTYYWVYMLALYVISCIITMQLSPLFAFLCLGGLPPLTIFWAKAFAILSLPTLYGIIVIFVSALSLGPYIQCSLGFYINPAQCYFTKALLVLLPSFALDFPFICVE